MKKYFIIAVFLFLGITTYSQDKYKITERTRITKSAIDSLEEAVTAIIRKDKQLRNIEGLKQLHIFYLPFRDYISKEEYLNKAFLNKLLPEYITYNLKSKVVKGHLMINDKKAKRCLETRFIIYDSNGKGKAIGEFYQLYKYKDDFDYNLINLYLNDEFDFVFQLDFFGDYICVKDSNIFVLKEDNSKGYIKDYNWEIYIDTLYDKLIKEKNEYDRYKLERLLSMTSIKDNKLENRINYLIYKNKSFSGMRGFKQFHIIYLKPDSLLSKEDFKDNLFISKLNYDSYIVNKKTFFKNKEDEYIKTRTFIYEDFNYEQIAEGNALGVARAKTSNLFKYFIKEKIEIVFNIGVENVYICVKDNDIFVIKDTNGIIQKYSKEEFIECCFEDLCPTCKM